MQQALESGNEAAEKMNFIADKLIWAGYAIVGGLASYAVLKIFGTYLVQPFMNTYRFLTNQSRNVQTTLSSRYGNGLAVICGQKSGMSPTYSRYMSEMGFKTILLISGSQEKLEE